MDFVAIATTSNSITSWPQSLHPLMIFIIVLNSADAQAPHTRVGLGYIKSSLWHSKDIINIITIIAVIFKYIYGNQQRIF